MSGGDTVPGTPGIAPTWASSAKDFVGGSLGPARLWFTIGYGIVNEVYFPRIDTPQIRDLGFIVADDAGFWCEVKRLGRYSIETPRPAFPPCASCTGTSASRCRCASSAIRGATCCSSR